MNIRGGPCVHRCAVGERGVPIVRRVVRIAIPNLGMIRQPNAMCGSTFVQWFVWFLNDGNLK